MQNVAVARLSPQTYCRVRRRTHDSLNHRRPELYRDLVRTDVGEPERH